MLQSYKEFMCYIGPMRNCKNKKAIWDCIATKLSRADRKVDGGQCENRYNLKKEISGMEF